MNNMANKSLADFTKYAEETVPLKPKRNIKKLMATRVTTETGGDRVADSLKDFINDIEVRSARRIARKVTNNLPPIAGTIGGTRLLLAGNRTGQGMDTDVDQYLGPAVDTLSPAVYRAELALARNPAIQRSLAEDTRRVLGKTAPHLGILAPFAAGSYLLSNRGINE